MGFLSLGTPYAWDDAKQYCDHVRQHGILQFLSIWDRLKDRVGDALLWGDEVEYVVVSLDHENRNARLSLRQSEILAELAEDEERQAGLPAAPGSVRAPTFHPEYGRYMLESTPGAPYGATMKDLLNVEKNMRLRRHITRQKLQKHEVPIYFTSFPRLGAPGVFLDPHHEPDGDASRSFFLPDQLINPHVRFPTLTANIRRRRGSKVAINMPIFHDTNTPKPFVDPNIPWERNMFPEDKDAREGAALPDHIYMDSMGFGMGCCCLQLTFQACSVNEARRVYDALLPVGPIMLALTAAAPIFRGYLADVDCRWNVIAGSVDDRTPEERGLKPLKEGQRYIPKSRYDSSDCYLSLDPENRPEYNDTYMPIDEDIKQKLTDHGVDELLSKHLAHLFIRDPLVIFSESVCQDDKVSSDHFENLQSTNWQTMRFKPPPPGSDIGWRVEFRSMEVQFTDTENAAFSIFIVLLTRAILSFRLNLYVPISKVDENMKRAHRRNACREEKFFFRKDLFQRRRNHSPPHSRRGTVCSTMTNGTSSTNGHHHTNGFLNGHTTPITPNGAANPNGPTRARSPSPLVSPAIASARSEDINLNGSSTSSSRPDSPASSTGTATLPPVEEEYTEMTIDEIMNGKSDIGFPGLIGLVQSYVNSLNLDVETRCGLEKHINFIRKRANGSLITTATWLRNYVRSHPEYKFDSVVSQGILYDMVQKLEAIEKGEERADDLLGKDYHPSPLPKMKGNNIYY